MSFNTVILAAGEGKRMKSRIHKVLHEVCGKPLVDWVLGAATDAGSEKTTVVVGHLAEAVKEHLGSGVSFALQSEQLGTGHAVIMAKDTLDITKDTLVTCGDMPLITSDTIKKAYEFHQKNNNALTVLTAELDNPYGYGRVVRNENGICKIVEQKDATEEEKAVKEINSGTYFFNTEALLGALAKLKNNNAQNEYYLTDTVGIMLSEGKRADAFIIEDNNEIMGINDRCQLEAANRIMRERIIKKHMANGVTFIDKNTVYIGSEVQIGMDTVVYPNTILEGKTKIGEACVISGSKIVNSEIGGLTDVTNSVILDSTVGSKVHVGPFAYIRPNSKIADNIKIGDFVEIKNSSIGNGTKVSHLTYVGDADVGENVNFGCGTVLVNYDGANKHRSTIHDNAFIGCNTNLVSPVTVNKDAFIAAGSTITDDVPESTLAIARARQVIKDKWRRTSK